MGKRALIVTRLSKVTEATTSPERQERACRELCEQRGYEVVGVADDPDVSAGSTTPFTRPTLGPWLRDRHHEYDVLVVYRMDRLVRRLLDLADVIRWGQAHNVAIVSATESFLDLDAPFGDIIALLVAKVAEMELEAISTRNASASHHNIRSGKWRGGVPPWGYIPEKDTEGVWRLVRDPVQVDVIHEVVRRVLEGEPLRPIAADLTARGVLTPRDRFAQVKGRGTAGYAWSSGRMKEQLLSRTLLGQIVTRDPILDETGRPRRDERGQRMLGPEFVVVGDDGTPVIRAEPILTREVFDRVGAVLRSREVARTAEGSSGLLLRVLHCGVCGRPAYRLKGGPGRKPRYRCASVQERQGRGPCGNASITLDAADTAVETHVLSRVGAWERTARVWHAGSDTTAERSEIDVLLADLTDQLGTGVFRRGTPQRERLDARIAALAERQAALRAAPAEPAGWRYEGTGETVAQWWARVDATTKNSWLREVGITARWRSSTGGNGRLTVEALDVDMGKGPHLSSEVLPGPLAGGAVATAAHGEQYAPVHEALNERLWHGGDPLDTEDGNGRA